MRGNRLVMAVAAVSVLVTACSGGADESGTSSTTDSTAATSAETAPPTTATSAPTTDSTAAASAETAPPTTATSAPTTAATPPTSPPTTVPSEPMIDAAVGALVGVWQTDAADQLAVLLPGGTPPVCSGPFTVTFTSEGTFAVDLDATCQIDETTGTGVGHLDGAYTDDGSTFTLSDITGEGSITVMGFTQPLPILDGYRQAFSSPTPYTITSDSGVDVLTYSFSGQSFSLTRVG